MEEYDFHSSAEHSPSGYYHNNNNNNGRTANKNKLTNGEMKIKFNCCNNYLNQSSSFYHPTTNHFLHSTRNSKSNINGKDIRRQAGHWSNTNLESQLGYMP